MLPLSDRLTARKFRLVNGLDLLRAAHVNEAVYHASFYPCTVGNACQGPEPWGLTS